MTLGFAFLLCGSSLTLFAQRDWPTYGGDAGNTRYSPLKLVNRGNVAKLGRAWTYHMSAPVSQGNDGKQGKGGARTRSSEATPIVADGLMYLPTPFNRVVALEPETGTEAW